MKMRKKKVGSSFRKRFIELDGPVLKYYDEYVPDDPNNVPRGDIALEKNRTRVLQGDAKTFEVTAISGDVYIFEPQQSMDVYMWVNKINEHMSDASEIIKVKGANYVQDASPQGRKIKKRNSFMRTKMLKLQLDNTDGDSNTDSFDVMVPEGYEPGQKLRVEHNGRYLNVHIPEGVYEGQSFEVRVAKKSTPMKKGEQTQHAGWLIKYGRNGTTSKGKQKWVVLTDKEVR